MRFFLKKKDPSFLIASAFPAQKKNTWHYFIRYSVAGSFLILHWNPTFFFFCIQKGYIFFIGLFARLSILIACIFLPIACPSSRCETSASRQVVLQMGKTSSKESQHTDWEKVVPSTACKDTGGGTSGLNIKHWASLKQVAQIPPEPCRSSHHLWWNCSLSLNGQLNYYW